MDSPMLTSASTHGVRYEWVGTLLTGLALAGIGQRHRCCGSAWAAPHRLQALTRSLAVAGPKVGSPAATAARPVGPAPLTEPVPLPHWPSGKRARGSLSPPLQKTQFALNYPDAVILRRSSLAACRLEVRSWQRVGRV